MRDPKVLAFRRLVEIAPNEELQKVVPIRQAIVTIETGDGRTLRHRTDVVRGTARNPMVGLERVGKSAANWRDATIRWRSYKRCRENYRSYFMCFLLLQCVP